MSLSSDDALPEAATEAPEASAHAPAPAPPGALELVTAEGRKLQVKVTVDRVIDLRACKTAGHRIEAHIFETALSRDLPSAERRSLLPRDYAAIDSAVMDRSLETLKAASEGQGAPRLIVQLSFVSLSNSRIRSSLMTRAGVHDQLLKQGAICEIGDVENGVPINTLMELNALVRPYFRGVWMQVQPSRGLIETAKAARINGLSVRAADLGADAAAVSRGLKAFMALAQGAAQILTISGLPNAELQAEALELGFTHATISA